MGENHLGMEYRSTFWGAHLVKFGILHAPLEVRLQVDEIHHTLDLQPLVEDHVVVLLRRCPPAPHLLDDRSRHPPHREEHLHRVCRVEPEVEGDVRNDLPLQVLEGDPHEAPSPQGSPQRVVRDDHRPNREQARVGLDCAVDCGVGRTALEPRVDPGREVLRLRRHGPVKAQAQKSDGNARAQSGGDGFMGAGAVPLKDSRLNATHQNRPRPHL